MILISNRKSFIEELLTMKENSEISSEAYDKILNILRENSKAQVKTKDNKNIKKDNGKKEKITNGQNNQLTLMFVVGMILVLFSGLILGTSTWKYMNNVVKIITFTIVNMLFFVTSIFTDKRIKIPKTSLTLWILGSVFLPINFLCVSYLGLIGEYFSFKGDGIYIYGIVAILLCIPIYIYSSKKYKSRTFIIVILIGILIALELLCIQVKLAFKYNFLVWITYIILTLILYGQIKKENYIKKGIRYFTMSITGIMCINTIVAAIMFILETYISGPTSINTILIMLRLIFIIGVITYWSKELKINIGLLLMIFISILSQVICSILNITIDNVLNYLLNFIIIGGSTILIINNKMSIANYLKKYIGIMSIVLLGASTFMAYMCINKFLAITLIYLLAIFIKLVIRTDSANLQKELNIIFKMDLIIANVLFLNKIAFEISKKEVIFIYLMMSLVCMVISQLLNKRDFKDIFISTGNVILFLGLYETYETNTPFYTKIILYSSICIALYYNGINSEKEMNKGIYLVSSTIFGYLSYRQIVLNTELIDIFETELLLVPAVIIAKFWLKKYKNNYNVIFAFIYLIAACILFSNQSYDYLEAILIIAIFMFSVMRGYKIKNIVYFLGGIIGLTIEIIMNTMNFWKNVPWWLYLLFGGISLILFATKSEINNSNRKIIEEIKSYIRNWNT